MACNFFVYRDTETGKYFIKEAEGSFFLYSSGCADSGNICGPCTTPQLACACYELPAVSVSDDGTLTPSGEIPPQTGYYLPRYANVTVSNSDVVSLNVEEWEIWTPTGVCDSGVPPFGDVGGVTYNVLETGMAITCASAGDAPITLSWNGSQWAFNWVYSVNCDGGGGCSGGEFTNGVPLQVRYRRDYGDFVTKETQTWTATENCDFGGGPYSNDVKLTITFTPTCRPPDTVQYCNCLTDETVIPLASLTTYDAPIESGSTCFGKPIDIDNECGDVGSVTNWSMYYAPYANTVPVIDGVAYDTTGITGTDVVLIKTFSTQAEVRTWTCEHLKFATIGQNWPTDPNDLEYNWPFNDLYFNDCGGGDGAINLVPC